MSALDLLAKGGTPEPCTALALGALPILLALLVAWCWDAYSEVRDRGD